MAVRVQWMRRGKNSESVPDIAVKEPGMSISMEQMEEILESFNDHDVERIVSHFDEEGSS